MSKMAVIELGGIQHVVAKGDQLTARAGKNAADKIDIKPLMTYESGSDKVEIGKPELDSKVTLKKIEEYQGDKVQAIRYKAKKRVHKVRGHRDHLVKYEVTAV